MDKQLKLYFKNIKKNLPCVNSAIRKMLAELNLSVDEYIQENADADIVEIERHFGTSAAIAKEFAGGLDDSYIKSYKIKKRFITAIVSILLCVFVVFSSLAVYIVINSERNKPEDFKPTDFVFFYERLDADTHNEKDGSISTEETIISETTEQLADGSSITTTVKKLATNAAPTKTSIVGGKSYVVEDKYGNILFRFEVKGNFEITEGISATCTSVTCTASDLANGWSYEISSRKKSGNKAKATAIFKYDSLFLTTITQEISATVSCDAAGNLS